MASEEKKSAKEIFAEKIGTDKDTATTVTVEAVRTLTFFKEKVYTSPLMLELDNKEKPSVETICEYCPKAVWFEENDKIKCYCTLLYLISWEKTAEQKTMKRCDGQSLAMLELLSKEA